MATKDEMAYCLTHGPFYSGFARCPQCEQSAPSGEPCNHEVGRTITCRLGTYGCSIHDAAPAQAEKCLAPDPEVCNNPNNHPKHCHCHQPQPAAQPTARECAVEELAMHIFRLSLNSISAFLRINPNPDNHSDTIAEIVKEIEAYAHATHTDAQRIENMPPIEWEERAEIRKLKMEIADLRRQLEEANERAEKAEAELEQLRASQGKQ